MGSDMNSRNGCDSVACRTFSLSFVFLKKASVLLMEAFFGVFLRVLLRCRATMK